MGGDKVVDIENNQRPGQIKEITRVSPCPCHESEPGEVGGDGGSINPRNIYNLCLPLVTSLEVIRLSPVISRDQGHSLMMVLDENRNCSVSKISYLDKPKIIHWIKVSLTSITCTILEYVHSNMMDHILQNDMLCGNQHGFRAKRSCEASLLWPYKTLPASYTRGMIN